MEAMELLGEIISYVDLAMGLSVKEKISWVYTSKCYHNRFHNSKSWNFNKINWNVTITLSLDETKKWLLSIRDLQLWSYYKNYNC